MPPPLQAVYHPNAGVWNAEAVERPQTVQFFYGWLVEVRRQVPVVYNERGKFEPVWEPEARYVVTGKPDDPTVPLLPRAPILELVEYTVMLDNSTISAEASGPGVVVVQNAIRGEELRSGTRVAVRVVGNSAHVLAASELHRPGRIDRTTITALGSGPMPIPLSYKPPPAPILLGPCGYDRGC